MNPDDLAPGGQDGAREIARFFAGLPKDPAALAAALDQARVAQEAELAAAGVHPVTVVHGDVTCPDDERLIHAPGGLHALADRAGQYHRISGGNDYTTWFFDGPGAEQAALNFHAAASAIARTWWTITQTSYPVFGR